jgi:NAD(P)-dependent dehydrogenase (short-subunit alcohol dehydrogenase family)
MAPAQKVVDEIRAFGGEAVANSDDVAEWDSAASIVKTAIDHFGDLDVVVNNAGFVRDRMFVSATIDEWDATMKVHLRGHFCVSRHAVDHWRVRAKQGKTVDARIINTSSGAGLNGSIAQSAYSAAKGGIASLTLVQSAELKRYGITANALAPAARTRMTEQAFADKMKKPQSGFDAQDPDNVAPTVVWLGSTASKDVTGCVFELEGGSIKIADGWNDGPRIDKGARWEPAEVGPAIAKLLAQRRPPKKVYGT